MAISRPTPNFNSAIEKAQKIYEQLELDGNFVQENNGKFIAIEPLSGDYFIGETREEAVMLANKKYEEEVVYIRRIGNLEKVALHSPLELNGQAYACIL